MLGVIIDRDKKWRRRRRRREEGIEEQEEDPFPDKTSGQNCSFYSERARK